MTTAHIYRDMYGDELTITAHPVDDKIELFENCRPGAESEPVAVIYTTKPVELTTLRPKKRRSRWHPKDKRAAAWHRGFDRGLAWGMFLGAATVGLILGSIWLANSVLS